MMGESRLVNGVFPLKANRARRRALSVSLTPRVHHEGALQQLGLVLSY